jgi:hypothetical protein
LIDRPFNKEFTDLHPEVLPSDLEYSGSDASSDELSEETWIATRLAKLRELQGLEEEELDPNLKPKTLAESTKGGVLSELKTIQKYDLSKDKSYSFRKTSARPKPV